ncbi:TraB/GumN family protein [Paracoccus sp. 1_MG-2023]|uniref:TraB/GumN family protein n=1 Tax=unclassified Paracoccus (in: a-proteobacteria) TaxID=2688777 RepID=UPI001C08F78A|nr:MULTISPECIES: TraB/GumN family protein [unclassified Paracoccus (in: a-proteobacteria)]MBU2956698.1 TraB/GumN family protein [Paracoccus sp. C2R09]MDO6669262.1 TraB/GumN family protein [Paracoccus sp. 1_MG-2023]
MRKTLIALVVSLFGAGAVHAANGCEGQNLFDQLDPDDRRELEDATAGVPFRRGILWRARRGDQQITLVGTYHFDDPRHRDTLAVIAPRIRDASALYVEAGPEEEAQLTRALQSDPSLMIDPEGPTLPERLSEEEWQELAIAMEDRGTPAVVASRMRPWYAAMILGVSPCMIRSMNGEVEGLDRQLVEVAQQGDVPVRALEPWDTIFDIFAGLSPKDEIDMIRAALPSASLADDYAVTLADAYFAGDVWKIWEFGRLEALRNAALPKAEIERQMELAQTRLMDNRNRAWVAPLVEGAEDAARDGKGIVAGFGALHLPGENGVLALLAREGFAVTPIDG